MDGLMSLASIDEVLMKEQNKDVCENKCWLEDQIFPK
jgi:hypothetical protein